MTPTSGKKKIYIFRHFCHICIWHVMRAELHEFTKLKNLTSSFTTVCSIFQLSHLSAFMLSDQGSLLQWILGGVCEDLNSRQKTSVENPCPVSAVLFFIETFNYLNPICLKTGMVEASSHQWQQPWLHFSPFYNKLAWSWHGWKVPCQRNSLVQAFPSC